MRLRNIPGSRETIAESPYVVHDEESYKGKWHELFAGFRHLFEHLKLKKPLNMPLGGNFFCQIRKIKCCTALYFVV